MLLVCSTSSSKQSPAQFWQAETQKRFNVLAPLLLRKPFWVLFWLWGTVYVNLFFFFFFFPHKCCRLNFVPNNPDSVPAHFLDEPLSSIMTNYGAWWYVTGTSPPLRGCGGNKKTERNIPGPKKKKKKIKRGMWGKQQGSLQIDYSWFRSSLLMDYLQVFPKCCQLFPWE